MRTRGLTRRDALSDLRLDAQFFLSDGRIAFDTLTDAHNGGLDLVELSSIASAIWSPNRFKRAYAAPGEPALPYLRPYDVFDYLPAAADQISTLRTKNMGKYQLKKGTLLQTCSGRNLGPGTVVDSHLAGFMLSHDMVRVEIEDEELLYYVAAYLRSAIGQQVIRRDKTGSVIDHISDVHMKRQVIPIPSPQDLSETSDLMRRSSETRSAARSTIAGLLNEYERTLPVTARMRP